MMNEFFGNQEADNTDKSQINLLLDDYDDIFSDFDSREYSQKSLSDDFLQETKKASLDKVPGFIELMILLPPHKRDIALENTISKRLKNHFNKHYKMLKDEKNKIITRGIIFFIIGMSLLIVSGLYYYLEPQRTLLLSLIIVIMDPGGFFLFWEGLDSIIYGPNEIKRELEFYHKMSKADIIFETYKQCSTQAPNSPQIKKDFQ